MGLDFMGALEAEVTNIAADDAVCAVVIRGAGEENFSVGMNLKELPEGVKRMGSLEALFDQRLWVLDAIENLGKPVVAVLYGYCLGGGSSCRSRVTSGSWLPRARASGWPG